MNFNLLNQEKALEEVQRAMELIVKNLQKYQCLFTHF